MTETTPADDRPGVTPHRLTAELLAASPADQAALRQQIAEALAGHAGSKAFLADGHEWEHARSAWCAHADAVLAVLPDPAAIRAAALNEGADAIDAETRQAKTDGVLEPDKFRPCRDASAQLRALAGCQECASGIEHTEHCPYPESHNWGCGRPTDQSASGPGGAAGETQQDETQADRNSGVGWYEVIHPRNATTCIAYAHEDGSLYLPEGDDLTPDEFAFAAARGQAHRLVRADDPAAVSQPGKEA